MRSIPVDSTNLTFVHLETIAKMKRDDRGKSTQGETADGLPQWTIRAVCNAPDEKPVIIEVTVALAKEPSLPMLSEIDFGGLVARSWAMDGRSGISFSAGNVRAKASSNGTKPSTPAAAAAS
ncbi:MAG: hypothetical protein AB7L13_23890 [Acidimicrobiia bacterium]